MTFIGFKKNKNKKGLRVVRPDAFDVEGGCRRGLEGANVLGGGPLKASLMLCAPTG